MKNKVLFLLAVYTALHIAEACQNPCDCPEPEFAHFDYHAITAQANTPSVTTGFVIQLTADSIEFIAQNTLQHGFSLLSSAMACKCADDGYQGDKIAIQQINVFANRAFNDTLPAGASLNALFQNLPTGDGAPVRFGGPNRPLDLLTFQRPAVTGVPYRFTVQIIKVSGDTLSAQTGAVYF